MNDVVGTLFFTRRDNLHSPSSIDEMLSEQASKEYCQWARGEMDRDAQGNSSIETNQDGVLKGRSILDGSLQIAVPLVIKKLVTCCNLSSSVAI